MTKRPTSLHEMADRPDRGETLTYDALDRELRFKNSQEKVKCPNTLGAQCARSLYFPPMYAATSKCGVPPKSNKPIIAPTE